MFFVIIICWLFFFFLKRWLMFFWVILFHILFQENFYLTLSFYFSMRWRPSQCREGLKWNFLKTKVEIITVSSGSQNKSCKKWCKCMNVRMCAIFFIFYILDFFSILAFRKRCMSVLRTYEHIYEILWWFMRMYV